MSAPTAQGLLRMLDKRRVAAETEALGNLDDVHTEVVRSALANVSPKARVDVAVLMESVRREVAERAQAEAEHRRATGADLLGAIKYGWSLKPLHELHDIRAELQAKLDGGETTIDTRKLSQIGARANITARIEPDPDPNTIAAHRSGDRPHPQQYPAGQPGEDAVEDQPPRRGVRRLRRRQIKDALEAAAQPNPPPAAKSRSVTAPDRPTRRSARVLGPRVFRDGVDLTPEIADFPNPPWVIDDPDADAA